MMTTFLRSVACALWMLGIEPFAAVAEELKCSSPDGATTVYVQLNDEGAPQYRIEHCQCDYLQWSPLGLKTNVGDYTQTLTLKKSAQRTVEDHYQLSTIKQSQVDVCANELTLSYAQKGKHVMDIIFRVSNHDVAYRYQLLPVGHRTSCVVQGEASAFVVPQGTTSFLCPQAAAMSGWERTMPSYETEYAFDDAVGKNGRGFGYTFPCLFKVALPQSKEGWLLISETGVDGKYCASHLEGTQGGKYSIAFPMPDECNGWGTSEPIMSLPATTPWRTITLGSTLQAVVETTVPFDLVQPKYKASKEYTYGKGTWSWIIRMDKSCNYAEQKEYIDFAAALGYRSVLVDAHWDTQIGYKKMEELAAYAATKGVGLFLWYNSNGVWNDAPQGPRQKMHHYRVRQQEMAWMQKHGILGIKVDFFGGDKQCMMQLYEDILTDANDYGLQVIFHGCTLPRGWERMYPNYVASEAVLASENLYFQQHYCDHEAANATMHTFARNAVGSMDFGGSALNKRYHQSNQRGSIRRTSDVYALATAVLFQSSVQHFALAPNNLQDAPQWAVDFMKQVPTTWDEVKFVDGYPGKYAILARRHADTWFVAGVNAQENVVTQTITLPGDMARKQVVIYADDAQLQGTMKQLKTNKKGEVKVTIPKNGGVVIVAR